MVDKKMVVGAYSLEIERTLASSFILTGMHYIVTIWWNFEPA